MYGVQSFSFSHLLLFPFPPQSAGGQAVGCVHSQKSLPGLAKGIFHTMLSNRKCGIGRRGCFYSFIYLFIYLFLLICFFFFSSKVAVGAVGDCMDTGCLCEMVSDCICNACLFLWVFSCMFDCSYFLHLINCFLL